MTQPGAAPRSGRGRRPERRRPPEGAAARWGHLAPILAVVAALAGCGGDGDGTTSGAATPGPTAEGPVADVTAVRTRRQGEAWTFLVTVASPDSGCGQFADWWEVVDDAGRLVYRRVLLHSHVSEQPFTRSGGPVPVAGTDSVWVRAHMNVAPGYGGQALRGTAAGGVAAAPLPAGFAADLAQVDPLPQGCAF